MKALICDIDGVVLHDDTALPGAGELVARLVGGSMPFLFLTNFPSQTPADLRDRFRMAGIEVEVPVKHFYTSAIATAEFLNDQAGDRRKAYVIGEGALIHALYEAGFVLTENDADFVVLGETRSYSFDMIRRASYLIQRGRASWPPTRTWPGRRAGPPAGRWRRPSSASPASGPSTWASPMHS